MTPYEHIKKALQDNNAVQLIEGTKFGNGARVEMWTIQGKTLLLERQNEHGFYQMYAPATNSIHVKDDIAYIKKLSKKEQHILNPRLITKSVELTYGARAGIMIACKEMVSNLEKMASLCGQFEDRDSERSLKKQANQYKALIELIGSLT